MPEARVELARGCPRRILSPLRLPFRHSGYGDKINGPDRARTPLALQVRTSHPRSVSFPTAVHLPTSISLSDSVIEALPHQE